jgi:hypothetical protein
VSRDVISDEVWAVIGPLFPRAKSTGRPRWIDAPWSRRRRGDSGRERRGETCLSGSGTGTRSTRTSTGGPRPESGRGCWRRCSPSLTRPVTSTGSRRLTPRSCAGVHPHSRASGRHEHAAGNALADPRRPCHWQSTVAPGPGIADNGYPSRANKAWLRKRGIAMRSDKTARNYHAGLCLAATLHWLPAALATRPSGRA